MDAYKRAKSELFRRGQMIECLATLIQNLDPEKLERRQQQPCPVCKGNTRLYANRDIEETGSIACHVCGVSCPDIIESLIHFGRMSKPAALGAVEDFLGLPPSQAGKNTTRNQKPRTSRPYDPQKAAPSMKQPPREIKDYGKLTKPERDARDEWYRRIDKPQGSTVYEYTNIDGEHLFETVRFLRDGKKSFIQRTWHGVGDIPDPKSGLIRWKNVKDVPGLDLETPYRLHDLAGKKLIFIVEGEKDVQTLGKNLLNATCNHGGAGKFREGHALKLAGHCPAAKFVVIADNDEPGRKHARQVAERMHAAGGAVAILDLDQKEPGADVTDWINSHTSAKEASEILKTLGLTAAKFSPPAKQEPAKPTAGEPITFPGSEEIDARSLYPPETYAENALPIVYERTTSDFPMDKLSMSCSARFWAEDVGRIIKTPPESAYFALLAVCSGLLARRVKLDITGTDTHHLNIYGLTIMKSGQGKSASLDILIEILDEIEQQLTDATGAERNRQRAVIEELNNDLESARAEVRRADRGSPERRALQDEVAELRIQVEAAEKELAALPKYASQQASQPELARLLGVYGRMMVLDSEGAIWKSIGGAFNRGAADLDIVIKGYKGERIRQDFKTVGGVDARNPILTMSLAIQDSEAEKILSCDEYNRRGLLSRFMFCAPPPVRKTGKINREKLDAEIQGRVFNLLRTFASLEDNADKEHWIHLEMTSEALDEFERHTMKWEPQTNEGNSLADIPDAGSRFREHLARLTGVLHCMDLFELKGLGEADTQAMFPTFTEFAPILEANRTVSAATVKRAAALATYFIQNMITVRRGYGSSDVMAINNAQKMLKKLVAAARNRKTLWFTRSEITKICQHGPKSKDERDEALDMLEHYNHVFREETNFLMTGGRPRDNYYLNPKHYHSVGNEI